MTHLHMVNQVTLQKLVGMSEIWTDRMKILTKNGPFLIPNDIHHLFLKHISSRKPR
jgi:hypothetical protein